MYIFFDKITFPKETFCLVNNIFQVTMIYKKMQFAKVLISLSEYYKCDGNRGNKNINTQLSLFSPT